MEQLSTSEPSVALPVAMEPRELPKIHFLRSRAVEAAVIETVEITVTGENSHEACSNFEWLLQNQDRLKLSTFNDSKKPNGG